VTASSARRLAVLCWTALSLDLAGCAEDWETLPIRSFDLDGEASVRVEGHCNEDGRVVVVDEDADRVELRLEVRGERRGDCLDCPAATLDEPLADRAVIDASTGVPVPLAPDIC
jgi:hypothetical protein